MRVAKFFGCLCLVIVPATAQVELVSDIYPGAEDSVPSYFNEFQGNLYFSAKSPAFGGEVWRYDGTSVSLAMDLIRGPESGQPWALRTVGNQLFFLATNGETGWEPWLSDGDSAFLVQDIWPGAQGQPSPHSFTVLDGRLFFRANDIVHGYEQWVVEGDSARLVADINPGSGDAWIEDNTSFNGEVFFHACRIEWDCELWATDGIETRLVGDIIPGDVGSSPRDFVAYQGYLLFRAAGDAWRTDGVDVEFAPGFDNANNIGLGGATEYLGNLFFTATTSATGEELWRYDGNEAVMVEDLEPGEGGSYPRFLGQFDDALYFRTCDWDVYPEPSTCRLWELRGDHRSGLRAGDLEELGQWQSTEAGPISITEWRGKLYMRVHDDAHGSELWILEDEGPQLLVDMVPGPETGVYSLTVFEDQLLFSGRDAAHGWELWRVQDQTTSNEEPENSNRSGLHVYPNPASSTATFEFNLISSRRIHIKVLDALGRVVAVVHDGPLAAGGHSLSFSLESLPSGVYVVRADFGNASVVSRTITVMH